MPPSGVWSDDLTSMRSARVVRETGTGGASVVDQLQDLTRTADSRRPSAIAASARLRSEPVRRRDQAVGNGHDPVPATTVISTREQPVEIDTRPARRAADRADQLTWEIASVVGSVLSGQQAQSMRGHARVLPALGSPMNGHLGQLDRQSASNFH